MTIQENGEVGDHSNDPGFYDSPVPVLNLATIALVVSDLENYAYGMPLTGDYRSFLLKHFQSSNRFSHLSYS